MTIDEFEKLLDQKNCYREDLCSTVEHLLYRGMILETKGANLLASIRQYIPRRRFPLVDQRLGVVFWCSVGAHELMRTELYRYRYYANGFECEHVDSDESADRYLNEGYGWFISAMRPQTIVVGKKYRPDKWDEESFANHMVEHQAYTIKASMYRRRF